jgi:acyl dehydratase
MPIRYPDILKLKTEGARYAWSDREVMLYALGIGMGSDPTNQNELQYVNESYLNEKPLKVVPTFASVCVCGASPGSMNINRLMELDGERDIFFHKPLPAAAQVHADARVLDVFDKGKNKGAVIRFETVVKDARSNEKLATLISSIFARGDGGLGGSSEGQPKPHTVPSRAPDRTMDFTTRADQALLYRLLGDRNPLHSDPEIAERAGFPAPNLHGLCTYGIACRAVLESYADYDPTAFKRHGARFSAPVYPGETITVDLWKDGDIVSFEARVKSRNVTVIKNGLTELR